MSIHIHKQHCKKCGKCLNVCPGNLIDMDFSGTAKISQPQKCWGCTACMKECPYQAIELGFLEDIRSNGTTMTVKNYKESIKWHIRYQDGEEKLLTTLKNKSNKY